MKFVDSGTLEPATVENVTAAILRLSLLDESEIQELAASGELTTRFPYLLSNKIPTAEMHVFQLALRAAPARALTEGERDRVDHGRPAVVPLRRSVAFLIRKFKTRSGSDS